MPYELIDHTGDIGIRVQAKTRDALFAEAARALFDIMIEGPAVSPVGSDTIEVSGEDTAETLRDFLSELLYRFSVERKIYGPFERSTGGLRAGWETYEAARHALRTELKAVTYHQLEATQEKDGWTAQVIFDV